MNTMNAPHKSLHQNHCNVWQLHHSRLRWCHYKVVPSALCLASQPSSGQHLRKGKKKPTSHCLVRNPMIRKVYPHEIFENSHFLMPKIYQNLKPFMSNSAPRPIRGLSPHLTRPTGSSLSRWGHLPRWHRAWAVGYGWMRKTQQGHSIHFAKFTVKRSIIEPAPWLPVNCEKLPESKWIYPLVDQHSYWKWSFIVSFRIKNCDFP